MLKPDHDDHADEVRDVEDAPGEDEADDETNVDEGSRASLPPQVWLVAACACLPAAGALWLLGHADAAFVAAALGVVAWFLNVRAQLKEKAKG